jgi:hypothetical protein
MVQYDRVLALFHLPGTLEALFTDPLRLSAMLIEALASMFYAYEMKLIIDFFNLSTKFIL